MALLKVYKYGSAVLREKTQPIDELPDNFDEIIADMFETMYDDDGIGLSANQVGLNHKFFIADFSLHDEKLSKGAFINLEILESSGESTMEEGCLSVPGIRENVTRPDKIKVRYRTKDGEDKTEEYEGFPARVIQHETDHLNGIFFVDRISSLKKSFIASKLRRLAEETRAEEEEE